MEKKRSARVRDVMTSTVFVCRADDTLEQAARLLWERDCGCLPVVDPDGVVLAMITDRDICMAAYTQGRGLRDIPVAAAMSTDLVRCHMQDVLTDVAARMGERGVRRLPVTDKTGRLVGILSVNDLALGCSEIPVDSDRGDQLVTPVIQTLIRISRRRRLDQDASNREPLTARPASKGIVADDPGTKGKSAEHTRG